MIRNIQWYQWWKSEKEKSDAPSLCLTRIRHRVYTRLYLIAKACLFLPFTLLTTCPISNRTDFGVWKRHRACRRIVDLCIQRVTKHVTWNTFGGYIPILGRLPIYSRFLCKYKPLVIRKISHIFELHQYVSLFLLWTRQNQSCKDLCVFFVFHSLYKVCLKFCLNSIISWNISIVFWWVS